MNKDVLKKLFKGGLLLSILVLIYGYIIDLMIDKIGKGSLIIAGVIEFTIAFCSALLGIFTYFLYIDKQLEDKVEILKDFIKAYGLGNIINEKTLAIWESAANSIWVVTLDLSNDIGLDNSKNIDKEIVKIVSANLSKGKKYIYFVPNTKEIRGALLQYKKIHSKFYKKGQVKFCIIPESQFHFVNEIVLYDVKENTPTRAVQWFPNKKLNYYLEIDEYYQTHLIGILDYMIETYGLKDIVEI